MAEHLRRADQHQLCRPRAELADDIHHHGYGRAVVNIESMQIESEFAARSSRKRQQATRKLVRIARRQIAFDKDDISWPLNNPRVHLIFIPMVRR